MNRRDALIRYKTLSSCILLMVLCAFAAQSLIPSGFMPSVRSGLMQIVICSGMGEKTITVQADKFQFPGHQNKKDDANPCAYQFLAAAKLLIPPTTADIPAPSYLTASATRPPALASDQAAAFSFDARGPPAA